MTSKDNRPLQPTRPSRTLLALAALLPLAAAGVHAQAGDRPSKPPMEASTRAASAGQAKTYRVADFSDRYTAELEAGDRDDVSLPGTVRIRDRRSGTLVVEVETAASMPGLDEGRVKSNVHEIPYGEQSLIVAGDFNFDGIRDIAVRDGSNSCYGGPSYQVYLDGKNGLRRSSAFTALAQEGYCGLFDADATTRTINAMTKSGCCWHRYDTYVIRNGEPLLQRRVDEDARSGGPVFAEETLYRDVGTRRVGSSHLLWNDEDIDILLSFALKPSGKRAALFVERIGEVDRLFYALRDRRDRIELVYPGGDGAGEGGETDNGFTLRRANNSLTFNNGGTRYVIRPDDIAGAPGIDVIQGARTRILLIDAASVRGSLEAIAGRGPHNVAGLADDGRIDAAP